MTILLERSGWIMRTFDDYLKHLEQERPDLIQGMLEEEQRMDAKNR